MTRLVNSVIYTGFSHHMNKSGLSQIINYIKPKYVFKIQRELKFSSIEFYTSKFFSIFKILGILPSNYLGFQSILQELKAISKDSHTIHYINPENCFFLMVLFRSIIKKKIISNIHLPPGKINESKTFFLKRMFPKSDAVICISPSQYYPIRRRFGTKKTKLIPHGIDTNFFKPSRENKIEPYRLICVGYNGRDLICLSKAINIVKEHFPLVKCDIVSPKVEVPFKSNLSFHQNIKDSELIQKYNKSHLVVLPLKYATANNSLLEAMALGKAIITTELIDTKYYLGKDNGYFFKNSNYLELAEKILFLFRNDSERIKLEKFSRKRALKFSWPRISKMYMSIYKSLNY